jgi:hypothetical protein
MPEEIVALAVLSLASLTALGFGLMRSINRHLERKWKGTQGVDAVGVLSDLEDLRARLESIEDVQMKVAELEERVDFAERMLSERPDRNVLPT